MSVIERKRCAIYTRKSTDEGLDKEFNSLDAQRESGENYIRAKAHENWKALPERYDDGGISGGTMERPGLQKMLDDIKAGKIDIVVVYKIDRLSRSMLDFLNMIRFFEEHKVSFVSVTQDLNTDTAMGRLVLNVLQSFAQFEREISSERIRDKIALSKEKGMWMGGIVPIGYDAQDGKLVVNEDEKVTVNFIFKRFVETASTTQIVKDLKKHGFQTKPRVSRRGRVTPARDFTKQALYKILNNKIYIGLIDHKAKGETYEGRHDSIIEMKLWNQAQAILSGNKMKKINFSKEERPYLLKGMLMGPDGCAMTPATAKKGNKRYRYYVNTKANKTYYDNCSLKSVSAQVLEEVVLFQAKRQLTSTEWVQRMLKSEEGETAGIHDVRAALDNFEAIWDELFPSEQARIMQLIISQVTVYPNKIHIVFRPPGMASVLHELLPDLSINADNHPDMYYVMEMTIPIDFKQSRNKKIITTPDGRDLTKPIQPEHDNALIKAIARAYKWESLLEDGTARSIAEIARTENMDRGYVASVIRLTSLAPDITTAIINGRQPRSLQLSSIIRKSLPYCWNEQRQMLGFDKKAA